MALKLIESSLSSPFGLEIERKFNDGWKETTTPRPAVHALYYIDYGQGSIGRPYWLSYDAYRLGLKDQLGRSINDIERNLFYGALRACSFADNKHHLKPCSFPECDVCGILRRSLVLQDSDFGRGIYTTAHSSKADQDSENIYARSKYKAMFLVNVVVGNPKLMREIDPTLMAPPPGYQSVEAVPQSQGGTLIHPETVVYQTEAALPTVLIIYESTSPDNDDPNDSPLVKAEREIAAICKSSFGRSNFFPYGSSGYKDCVRHFFVSSAEVSSSAVQPGAIADLAKIMTVLGKWKVQFAVKGGGHGTNPGMSSTTGIQIYMARFNEVHYDRATKAVEVGAGCLWDHVYLELAKYGRSVVGGARMGGVGVAGYLQGGGYSIKTNQYGLGIDNIVRFQVVLPDGNTVYTGPGQDLFEALKGGGCNFGIVVTYTLKTHAQGPCDISPPEFVFCPHDSDKVKDALADFAQNETRPQAVVVSTFRHFYVEGKIMPDIAVFCFYDGIIESNMKDPFQKFKDIKATQHSPPDAAKTTSKGADATDPNHGFLQTEFFNALETLGRMYWEVSDHSKYCPFTKDETGSLVDIASPAYDATLGAPRQPMQGVGEIARGRFACIMVTGFTRRLIDEMQTQADNSAQEMPMHGGIRILVDVWPFLPTIFDKSPPAAWPHKKGEAVSPLLAWYTWEGERNDDFWISEMNRALDAIRVVADSEGCTRGNAPVYLNTSLLETPVDEIYRGNLKKLGKTRSKFDPSDVMGKAGGFKIPLR